MAKKNTDLFDRMRQAGLRRQVAKTLSEISEGASKKAVQAARSAVSDLRSLADDIERRLPSTTRQPTPPARTTRPTTARAGATAPRASRSRTAGTTASPSASPATTRTVSRRTRTAAPNSTAAAAGTSVVRAPRGQNKAKILESLKTGPKTASEIAKETGIGTGTVGTTLSKLATSGEVVKAERGYGLPK